MNKFSDGREKRCAFSLVEVMIAVGIVAFTVTVSVGLISTFMASSRDNRDRSEIAAALNGLRSYLQEKVGFDTCYSWAANDSAPELVYVTYRANESTGAPNGDSSFVHSVWFDPASPPYPISQLEVAREGRWVKARLTYAENLMPDGTTATGSTGDFPHAHLIFEVGLAVVAQPTFPVPPRPTLESPIVVNR